MDQEAAASGDGASSAPPSGELVTTRLYDLYTLATRLGEALEPDALAQALLGSVTSATGASRCVIYQALDEGTTLELLASIGLDDALKALRWRLPLDAPLPVATAVRERRPLWFGSWAALVEAYPNLIDSRTPRSELQAVAALPLVSAGRCVGALGFSYVAPRPFDEPERAFLTAVARLCAQAVQRAQLFGAERRARQRAEALVEQTRTLERVARKLSAALDANAVCELVVGEGASALAAPIAGLWLPGPDGQLHRMAQVGLHDGLEQGTRTMPTDHDAPVCAAFRSATPVFLEGVHAYEQAYPASAKRVRDAGLRGEFAIACLPLSVEERVLGTVMFAFDSARPFTDADRAFMLVLAGHCAQALERVHLFAEQQSARKLAEAKREHLRRLQVTTIALASTVTRDQVAEVVVREGARAFGAQQGGLALADPDGRLKFLAMKDIPDAVWSKSATIDADAPMALAIAYRTGQVFAAENERELRAAGLASAAVHDALAIKAVLCAPIPVDDGPGGALGFGFVRERTFSERERQIAIDLANLAALALARARLFESEAEARRSAEAALDAARKAEARKDEFLAMLGHELRNPLAPMRTALELMKVRAPDAVPRERQVLERQVTHLTRLVDDLLDVSRITRGRLELRRQRVDLRAVLDKAVEQTTPLFEQRRQRLVTDVPAEPLAVIADEVRLAQVIANLLVNAARYSPHDATIHLGVRALQSGITIRIKDPGVGIPADLLAKIFEVFVQAPQDVARSTGGLGLGLAIVKQLVALHGGTVEAKSDGPGKGSEFVVTLPRAAEAPAPFPVAPPELLAPPPRAGTRVLVVDDNHDAAVLLSDFLRDAGYVTATAHDGPSALAEAERFHPTVVLLDIGLPVMDGYEVAARFVTAPDPPFLVALTGYGQEPDRARALAAGFRDHLVKPVEPPVLLARLAALTGGTRRGVLRSP